MTLRRADRAITDPAWLRALLHRVPAGVLAVTDGEGLPYAHPTTFAYDAATHSIVIHSAREGRMPALLAAHPRVCFTVFEAGAPLPGATAAAFSIAYASVIIAGHIVRIADDGEARQALQLLCDRFFPDLRVGRDYLPPSPVEVQRTAVYRIVIEAWSGKTNTGGRPDRKERGDDGRS